MSESTAKTIEELVAAVNEATQAHGAAVDRTAMSRREETECLNRLNRAQAALDKALDALRAGAHRDSDWKRDEALRTASRAAGA